MAENENRQRSLEDALKKIEKSYGKGAVMKLGEKVDTQIQTVSSGSLELDIALGVGGFPRGLLHFMRLRKFKNVVEWQRSSMLSTL